MDSKIIVKGRHYQSVCELTNYHCPNCGKEHVYQAEGEGDYYTGPSLYCVSCSFEFSMPSGGVDEDLVFRPCK